MYRVHREKVQSIREKKKQKIRRKNIKQLNLRSSHYFSAKALQAIASFTLRIMLPFN